MRFIKLNFLVYFISAVLILCVRGQASDRFSETAEVAVKGQAQVGLFAPLQMVLSDSLEWSVHPLVFFIMPHAEVKWMHPRVWGLSWASVHGFVYPTMLLRQLSREGTGGIISPEFDIPQMVSVYNGVLVSKQILAGQTLSASFGLNYAFISGRLDRRTSIDVPFIYPRMKAFYSGYQWKAGINISGSFSQSLSYHFDVLTFWADGAIENSAFLNWAMSRHFDLDVGYYLSYAHYPFGSKAHLFLPLADLLWHFEL